MGGRTQRGVGKGFLSSTLRAGWARTPSPSQRPRSLAREGGGLTCTQVGFRPETLSLSPYCTPMVLPEAACSLPSTPTATTHHLL